MKVKPGLFSRPRSATLISFSIIAGIVDSYISLGRDPAVFHHSSVEQVYGSIGVLCEALVVRDHANGRAAGVQLLQQIHYRFTVAGIKVSSRFVREQDRRFAGESARDRYALLLTTRELTRQMFRPMRHSHAVERL